MQCCRATKYFPSSKHPEIFLIIWATAASAKLGWKSPEDMLFMRFLIFPFSSQAGKMRASCPCSWSQPEPRNREACENEKGVGKNNKVPLAKPWILWKRKRIDQPWAICLASGIPRTLLTSTGSAPESWAFFSSVTLEKVKPFRLPGSRWLLFLVAVLATAPVNRVSIQRPGVRLVWVYQHCLEGASKQIISIFHWGCATSRDLWPARHLQAET